MNNQFLVIRKMKDFILQLDNLLIHYPKQEYVLKDQILKDSYEALTYMIEANLEDEKAPLQKKALCKLSWLDFYFEKSYKKKYISEKTFQKYMFALENIIKMMHGWVKHDGSKNR